MASPSKDKLQEQYNTSPYLSLAFAQSHPAHLFTIGRLFGLEPNLIEKAKILELGCASGGNIIPLAIQLPHAEITGIDLAEKQIEEGQKIINDLGLHNIKLKHQSILNFKDTEGSFDYIICHGVFSWVSKEVRHKIFEICKKYLKPNGIGYISYNTYPGWNMVNSVRDLMIWHTQKIDNPHEKAQQARAILKFITDGLQTDQSPYSAFLKNEIELISKQPDSYLLHEHLSNFNEPVYFHQFMESANQHQLSYLSDAFLAMMFTGNLPTQFATELNKIKDIIATEQYMDFIRNQRFRCTLLCHQERTIDRNINTNAIENFYLQLTANPTKEDFSEKDLKENTPISFTNGPFTITVRTQLTQHALLILHQERFKPIHYTELCEQLVKCYPQYDRNTIKSQLNDNLNMMRAVFANIIQISSFGGHYETAVSDYNTACPLVRYQVQRQNYVINRRHQVLVLDELSKYILPKIDGEHNMDAIVQYTIDGVKEGKLRLIDEQNKPITDNNQLSQKIEQACQATVDKLAKLALFVKTGE